MLPDFREKPKGPFVPLWIAPLATKNKSRFADMNREKAPWLYVASGQRI